MDLINNIALIALIAFVFFGLKQIYTSDYKNLQFRINTLEERLAKLERKKRSTNENR